MIKRIVRTALLNSTRAYQPFIHQPTLPELFEYSQSYTTSRLRLRLFSKQREPVKQCEAAIKMSAAPFAPQDPVKNASLLDLLKASKTERGARKVKGFSCKSNSFQVQNSTNGLIVDSWRFQEWDYKRDDLPIYARGLFLGTNDKNQPEICTRGYDKFFNTGEVEATKWENIEQNTKGPYELSLKENGCIIFVSGLHDDTLLVCSKHSTGPRDDVTTSHASAGDQWIDRQLKNIGKTRAELARELRTRNVTAVAELCDDDFEEHILAYTGDAAGLYLHGMNINTPGFMTYSGPQVQAFAKAWGFRTTDFLVLDDIKTTRKFLEDTAETGSYNGRDVEGFVIRCKSKHFTSGQYQDWFFKYKFEEPYLMYRQWRECTKALVAGHAQNIKKHVAITEEYLMFAKRHFQNNAKLAEAYNKNHGIIALRDAFLKEKNLKGSDIIRMEYAAVGGAPEDVRGDVVLVPIATIGCGKTTIAKALTKLFGWGHVQNDNIVGKNRPPRFTKEVLSQFENARVVFADRNNSGKQERQQIITDVHAQHMTARLVALNFPHPQERISKIKEVTFGRVRDRGDNHQTIQAASDMKKVEGIMNSFINRFDDLRQDIAPDNGFDAVITLDPAASSRDNLETTISKLYELYPKIFLDVEMPTSLDLDQAIDHAIREYKPDIKHTIGERGPTQPKSAKQQTLKPHGNPTVPKKRPLEYISIKLNRSTIYDVLRTMFFRNPGFDQFWRQLERDHRVQSEFHVTLMHRAASKTHPNQWEKYIAMHAAGGGGEDKLGSCSVELKGVAWDGRVMAIVVNSIDENWWCANEIPHVTVGTASNDIKPKESNDMLTRWHRNGSVGSDVTYIAIDSGCIVDGTVCGVLR